MRQSATRSVPAYFVEALTASQVGLWKTDFGADRTMGDETTALLFGIDPDEAARGLPLEAYARAIHHEDLDGFFGKIGHVRERGGLFVVEYRTRPRRGDQRWILARGRYARDPRSGVMTGRGIVIDITESKLDGQVEDGAFFLTARSADLETPLERAAGHAIAARKAIDEVTDPGRRTLRDGVDALLWRLGQALAHQNHG